MLKYAKVINEETKQCEVGLGEPTAIFDEVEKVRTWQEIENNVPIEKSETYIETMTVGEWYESIGMTEQEVELGYNGIWYLKGYAPKRPLEELKEAKREEINKARDAEEQGGFSYMGKVFDSDQVSCIRMMGASQALANAPAETTVTWTCQDNTTINLNGTEFDGLVVALATHSNTCHQKATELKAQIEKATSAEELEGIKWNQD